ncbi:hypothetical protein tb265_33170 [Gemmatimonadetes bacterium T265]|nr:hypothetical protein tb265_33170 [Gemmatimonadetes bacterium T265]
MPALPAEETRSMTRFRRPVRRAAGAVACGLLLAAGASGCRDFISSQTATRSPNTSTSVTDPGPIYVSMQAGLAITYEGPIARTAALYMQHVAGIARQQQGFDFYNVSTSDIDGGWQTIFGQGGASDARTVQTIARAQNDSLFIGVGKVHEAMLVGTAADVFGDVPYRQAFNQSKYPNPVFDPQLQVYGDVQTQLDSAINIFLKAKVGGTNLGPTGALPRGTARNYEIIYAGRTSAQIVRTYTAVANTLKARFYMHTAEVSQKLYGSPTAAYDSVLKYAQLGIQSPSDDYLTFHASSPSGSNNVWAQFQGARGDLGPGAAIINLMTARIKAGLDTTDRLAYYFSDACGGDGTDPGDYGGYRPGANTALPGGQGAPNCAGGYSDFNAFYAPDLRNPVVTYTETQLLLAEASYQKAGGGAAGIAAAQTYLDNVRGNETYGATGAGITTFAPQKSVPATLDNIMQEKYIDLYGSVEVWNDYKRTCLPPLAAAPTSTTSTQPRNEIPGRLPYGQSEINANRSTPTVPANGRNANDPNACPSYTYPTAF